MSPKIIQLRELLGEKFPAQKADCSPRGHFPTTLPQLDEEAGGLPTATLIEITGSVGCGSLLTGSLLRAAAREGRFAALVDCGGTFDPGSHRSGDFRRLLWARCTKVKQALHAADLLLRDGNVGLLFLDLQMTPIEELRRIPASTWYRFSRILENGSAPVFLVLTLRPIVEAVGLRLHLEGQFSVTAMRTRRAELERSWTARVGKQRRSRDTLFAMDAAALKTA